jgi:3-methyladenine DNA glycosylase/8-oxoguanine DNA glycosylase
MVRVAPITLRLGYRPPLAVAPMLRALRAHAVPGLELHGEGATTHTRVVMGPGGPALATVDLGTGEGEVTLTLRPADPRDVAHLVVAVRRWLDLDADPGPIAAALGADPLLSPLVAARPGLRVLGSPDGFECAVLTVLGQQASPAAGRARAGRLVTAYGRPASGGLSGFPGADELADADPVRLGETVGVSRSRAESVRALAAAARDGLDLTPRADRRRTRARLLALPGIGRWTADVLAVRALGDRDAFAPGDPVLRRALGASDAAAAEARSEAWGPWRAYALFHLWTAAAFARR